MNIISILTRTVFSCIIIVEQCGAQPGPRHLEEISIDLHRKKLLVFGGAEILPQEITNPKGLYEQGEDQFWRHFDGHGPVGRRGHAMIYHLDDRLTYLFAGVTGIQKDSLLFDTWSWNGIAWILLESSCPVKNPEGVYDSKNKSILIYGDASDKSREMYGSEQMFQLWEFKDGKWKMLSQSGPHPDGPFEMSFDSGRGALVIPVWDNEKLVVWEWIHNNWIQVSCSGDCPKARNRFGMAYSSSEALSYLFGGRDLFDRDIFLGDFWSWDGTQWRRIESNNAPPPLAGLTLEDSHGELILYGGVMLHQTKTRLTNEIWKWRGGSWAR